MHNMFASASSNANKERNNDAQLKKLLLMADNIRACLKSIYVPVTDSHYISHTPKNVK